MSSTATAADVLPQAPSRPVPGSRRQHAVRRFPKLPFLVSRLFFVGADPFNRPASLLAAGAVVSTIPIIIIVLIFQRKIVAGLTSGAVKG